MAAGPATQLVVDTPAFVSLGAKDVQAAGGTDFFFFFGTDFIVVRHQFVEPLAIFFGSFFQLLAHLFDHAQMFLALTFIVVLRLLNRFLVRNAQFLATDFGFFKSMMRLAKFTHRRRMFAIGERGKRVGKFKIDQALLINPAFFIESFHEPFPFAAFLLPKLQGRAEIRLRLGKFGHLISAVAVLAIDHGGFKSFFGANVTVRNRPQVMQRFNQSCRGEIFVTLAGIAERRDGADFTLQLRGPFERIAALLFKGLARFEKRFFYFLNFLFVLFPQSSQSIFIPSRALRR